MAVSRRTTIALVTAGAVVLGSAGGVAVAFLGGGPGAGTTTAAGPTTTPTPTPSTPTIAAGASDPDPGTAATAVATAFLKAWEKGDYAQMQAQLDSSGGDMGRVYGGMAQRLGIEKVVTTVGTPSIDGKVVPFEATLTLKGLGDLAYATELRVSRPPITQGTVAETTAPALTPARIHFTAYTVHPDLKAGQRLDLVRTAADRAPILDRNGRSLAKQPDLSANVLGTWSAATGKATGLQRVLDDQLGGADAKRTVAVVNATDGAVVSKVKTFPSTQPKPTGVRSTLDVRMQRAATKALEAAPARAALVALDVRTGEVRAIANNPISGLPPALNLAAPGSTFKIVTALAALRNGKTPSSTVQCPTTINAYGKVFKNHEKAPNRSMSLTEAFAESCNTAFIGLARSLPQGQLAAAAEDLGFNTVPQPLPIASKGGSYPTPRDGAELAASAIGQGRVEASPLQMASVAAAVASGTWRQPRLLADCSGCAEKALPDLARIRPMMRAVVTSGTGTAVAGVPGGKVYGKTGTAEFGSGTTLRNHAWFVGWQGDVAFAVYVEEGSSGGTTAAPIAARYLRALAAA